MVQWLRLHAPNAGQRGVGGHRFDQSLVKELRFHTLCSQKKPPKTCFLNNYFLAVPHGKWDLPQPGIEPTAPAALGVQSLNHWTTRKQKIKKKFFF